MDKYHKATFMRVIGFLCKYPFRMLCNKGERASIVWLVKETSFWYGEQFQSIRLDVNSSKGSLEEVAKTLDVSLRQIDTYQFVEEGHLLIGQITDSDGGEVTDRLSGELKKFFLFLSSIISSTADCTPNLRHCSKVWNKSMLQTV